ncbi:MAG: (d)CMP kinase [Lachnospiraceae bacterium]
MSFNIAIDGPAGAGKSTISKALAQKLGFVYFDTGATYRALAYFVLQSDINPDNEEEISKEVQNASVSIRYENGEQQVYLNGKNCTKFLREEKIGNTASKISAYKAVRAHLLSLQQEIAKTTDIIMDGRDVGTCVLPDAQVKIFLTASVQTRAKRRYEELLLKGQDADLGQIEKDIEERDIRDMSRAIAPLKQAEDAILVDSSYMNIDDVVNHILSIVNSKKRQAE